MNQKSPVDTCFVISPFGDPYDLYFTRILKPAVEDCGLFAVRGDSLFRPTSIMDDVWQSIQDAKLLVAELTGRNANVFYELGLAHAQSKPVILIARSMDDVPFDLRSIRVLIYDKEDPDWGLTLRSNLIQAIKEVVANPKSSIPTTFKTAVRSEVPEESETLLRLDTLESMVHRLVEQISYEAPVPAPRSRFLRLEDEKDLSLFEPGQRVAHAKFGLGKVLTVEGSGQELRAQVNFDKSGIKWLALRVAKLSIVVDE